MARDWREVESKYYMPCFRRQPMVLVRGEGTRVWDDTGKEYLDFVAGWAVNNLGHSHPAIADAVAEQARVLVQTSNQFYTVPQLELAEVLVENSCLDRVFFCNSGAEANEGAVKLATEVRQAAPQRRVRGHHGGQLLPRQDARHMVGDRKAARRRPLPAAAGRVRPRSLRRLGRDNGSDHR